MSFREGAPLGGVGRIVRTPGARDSIPGALPPELAFLDEIDDETLAVAVARAAHDGVTAERALIASGAFDEDAYYRRLAVRLGLDGRKRVLAFDASGDPLLALRAGLAPLAPAADAPRALFAPRGAAIRALIGRVDAGLLSPDSFAVCSPRRFGELVRARYARRLADAAANGLDLRSPALSARRGLDGGQIGFLASVAALAALSGFTAPAVALAAAAIALWTGFLAAILLRTLAVAASRTPPPPPLLPDAGLPDYTVIVPLYREAALVRQILAALEAIDYPRTKLDVKLAVEAMDLETLEAIVAARPPPWIEIVVAPDGAPRTKPRALNFALASARGDLTVIFDAEDVPQPDQLRHAAARFAAEPALACLQGRLVIHNVRESWLTRCFALEYAALFDFLDPGLAALGLPFGLGGTSNHFRTRHLRDLGGWDSWNVAEDADLGIRLSRAGLAVAALDSDTLEEAPSDLANWFRQRVRWQKGWMQTLITHSRHPARVARELGGARAAALAALLMSGTLGVLLWPLLAVGLVAHALSPIDPGAPRWRIYGDVAAYLVALAGAQSVLTPMIAAIRLRGLQDCRASLFLLPLYYLLVCAAAWAALYELVRRPFHWHKTEHRPRGLADFAGASGRSPSNF